MKRDELERATTVNNGGASSTARNLNAGGDEDLLRKAVDRQQQYNLDGFRLVESPPSQCQHESRPLPVTPQLPSTIPDSLVAKMTTQTPPTQGDTQPLSQWAYNHLLGANHSVGTETGDTHGDPTRGSGYVDIMAEIEKGSGSYAEAVDDPSAPVKTNGHNDKDEAGNSEEDEEEDDDAVDLLSQDIRAEPYPESKRFRVPKTPLTQGIKRKREELERSAQHQTPQLPINPFPVNPFGNLENSVGKTRLSQLFEATQAVTSPQVLPSEDLKGRPSPNFDQLQRPSTADSLLSPIQTSRSRFTRAVTEPQVNYVSMQESQEARERWNRLQEEERAKNDDFSDDEFRIPSPRTEDTPAWIMTTRRPKKQDKSPTRMNGPAKTGKARSPPSRRSRRPSLSPRQSGRTADKALPISDDVSVGDGTDNQSEDETEREDEDDKRVNLDEEIDELAEDNKENIGYRRTSVRRAYKELQAPASSLQSPYMRSHWAIRGTEPASVTQMQASPAMRSSQNGDKETWKSSPIIYDSQTSHLQRHHGIVLASSPANVSAPQSSQSNREVVAQSPIYLKRDTPASTPAVARNRKESLMATATSNSQHYPATPLGDSEQDEEDELHAPSKAHSVKGNIGSVQLGGSLLNRGSSSQSRSDRNTGNTQAPASSPEIPLRSTIPETTSTRYENTLSDQRPMPSTGPVRSTHAPLSNGNPPQSISSHSTTTLPFETAPEYSTLPADPAPARPPQHVHSSQTTPSNRVSPRKSISGIALDPTPPRLRIDIDEINIMDNDFIEYNNVISPPSSASRPSRDRRGGVEKGKTMPLSSLPGELTVSRERVEKLEAPRQTIIVQGNRRPGRQNRSFKPIEDPQSTPDDRPEWSQITSAAHSFNIEDDRSSSSLSSVSSKSHDDEEEELAGEAENKTARVSRSKDDRAPSEPQNLDPIPQHPEQINAEMEGRCEMPVVAPRRVLAQFKGNNPAFYSATCIDVIPGDEPRYVVRFDDGATDTVSSNCVKRLDILLGDTIKVDLPGARGFNYMVIGLRDAIDISTSTSKSESGASFPEVDIYGHTKLHVARKMHGTNEADQSEFDQMSLSWSQVYLTSTMWASLKGREYTHPAKIISTVPGPQTPMEFPATPTTPTSRSRRAKSSFMQPLRPLIAPTSEIFKNMVFTLSNITSPGELEQIKKLIQLNGGKVTDGFDTLFQIPPLSRCDTSVSIPDNHIDNDNDNNSNGLFQLRPHGLTAGFTCLIGDKHCRRAKYIQALALGIPCVATRWITDCAAKQRVLPWSAYSLPAGESAFLGHGAVRSRVLPDFDPSSASLPEMINARPLIFRDMSILLLIRAKGDEETAMKEYPLLISAMGPGNLVRVGSVDTAVKAVREVRKRGKVCDGWDYVVCSERALKEVERAVTGLMGERAKTAKRKSARDESINVDDARTGEATTTKVVGTEFVVQSLIVGKLIDD